MRVKLVIGLFICIFAVQLSKAQGLLPGLLLAPQSIQVSNTSMSPQQPITITLTEGHHFLINGEESGYWRARSESGVGDSFGSTATTHYEFYLKNPKDNTAMVCLSFDQDVYMETQPINQTTTTVSTVQGSNITGYVINESGQRTEKTLNFSPATKSGVSVVLSGANIMVSTS